MIWERCSNLLDYINLKNLSWGEIHFGIDLPDKGRGQLVNHVLILVKRLIFLGRGKNTQITEQSVKSQIEQDRLEEKRIAVLHNTLSVHLKKWENWLW